MNDKNIKLCVGCLFFNSDSNGCRRKIRAIGIDRVRGGLVYTTHKELKAYRERTSWFGCGKSGKHWKNKHEQVENMEESNYVYVIRWGLGTEYAQVTRDDLLRLKGVQNVKINDNICIGDCYLSVVVDEHNPDTVKLIVNEVIDKGFVSFLDESVINNLQVKKYRELPVDCKGQSSAEVHYRSGLDRMCVGGRQKYNFHKEEKHGQ